MNNGENNGNMGEAAALFAFMGWLTSRKQISGPFSDHHNANEAAQLVGQYCDIQGWTVEDERWFEKIKAVDEIEQLRQRIAKLERERAYVPMPYPVYPLNPFPSYPLFPVTHEYKIMSTGGTITQVEES